MSTNQRWTRTVRTAAAVIIGLGAVVPAVSACGSAEDIETEQVEEGSGEQEEGESGDREESDPEPDIEE